MQAQFLRLFNASGPIPTPQMKRNYLNFYGNLMKSSDAYLVKILDTLQSTGLLENTLVVATADHGEMGTAHGGLRQKNFNFYEESTRVPLVYSNPRLFKTPDQPRARIPRRLPADAREPRRGARQRPRGLAGGRLLRPDPQRSPKSATGLHGLHLRRLAVRPGQGPYPEPPNHVVSIREQRYKLARYYDAEGKVPDQWEMYDLKADPLERTNLAYRHHKRTPTQEREYRRLRRKLAKVEQNDCSR